MPIVAAVDRSDQATAIIEQAGQLGAAFEEPVHVVHVLTRKEFVSLERTNVTKSGSAVPIEEIEAIAEEIAAEAIEDAGADADAIGLVGKPAEEIVTYAETVDADYVVVGGRKRSPVGKALFGSVAQSVILSAESPIVMVKPPEKPA
ncbi:universal stress protein [Halegenticoccus tardaugens]|uniref:universal stress protein n=1 Tax=Halegenticoccus tardaugens TaxID=2071624 RepID=UPI00100BB841|nr:universal stress protein [Halegenticoccus tardaugens]